MPTPVPPADSPATYVVELTPPGRAAVAVVLVVGPNALGIIDKHFAAGSRRSIAETPINRIVVGRWDGADGEELVICRRAEDEIEIHSHGGVAAVGAIVDTLVTDGCRQLSWQDWLNMQCGRVSPRLDSASAAADATTCAAQIALAEAVTTRTAAILLDQLNGALSNATRDAIAAATENNWSHAADVIDSLLSRRALGLHLTSAWRVVFAGPPNVGKSSLMNALAGYERAIVSPIPGTTRDVVTLTTAIDGWPVLLADTAGLRDTHDELEAAGVDLAQAALANADVAILVSDVRDTESAVDAAPLTLPVRVVWVWNKVDLVLGGKDGGGDAPARPVIRTSALTGEGIADLAAAISKVLVPNPPAAGEAVPFTPAQIESLVVARNAIQRQHAAAATEALQSLLL